jgi:hypothetical protein
MVGLSNVDNTSDASKILSNATQTALNLKANIANPTFTGTVGGLTKSMVGLSNVDDTSDASKIISNATQAALNLKANIANPTFTGTVGLPANTINSGHIINGTILGEDISTNTITVTNIADNAITTNKILDGNVTLSKLNSNVTSLLGTSVSAPNLVFWSDQARTAAGTNNLLSVITSYDGLLVNFLTINNNGTTNATLTLPYSGTYIFTISGWRCGAGSGLVRVEATRNGTVVFDRRRGGATQDCSIFETSICWNLFLAGDVVRLYKNHNSGGTNVIGPINLISEDGVGPVRIVYHGGINTNNIGDLSVTSPKIADNAVTELKINNNAVTELKINNNAVTVNKIADLSVTYNKLAQDVRNILDSYNSRISSLEYSIGGGI